MTDTPPEDSSDPTATKNELKILSKRLDDLDFLMLTANADSYALEIALKAALTALDDTMPAVRSIVVQILDVELEATQNPRFEGSASVKEARIQALTELSVNIELDNKLIEEG